VAAGGKYEVSDWGGFRSFHFEVVRRWENDCWGEVDENVRVSEVGMELMVEKANQATTMGNEAKLKNQRQ
jgi:hypothetical protein